MVILESLSRHRPVIIFKEIEHVIKNRKGIFVSNRDNASLLETINYIIGTGVKKFIEIGPGKVLSGLVKRIDRNVSLIQVNDIDDIKNLN